MTDCGYILIYTLPKNATKDFDRVTDFCSSNFQWKTLPLVDNHPDDEYRFEVIVFTGFVKNAETSSKVSIILNGTMGTTGMRNLDDGLRKVSSKRLLIPLNFLS